MSGNKTAITEKNSANLSRLEDFIKNAGSSLAATRTNRTVPSKRPASKARSTAFGTTTTRLFARPCKRASGNANFNKYL